MTSQSRWVMDLARDQALVERVALAVRPFASQTKACGCRAVVLRRVVLALRQRECELPLAVAAHRLDELVGHQQRQVATAAGARSRA